MHIFFKHILTLTIFCCACTNTYAQSTKYLPARYNAENGAITGHNLQLYNNRPLYCDANAFILAGDRPLIRLVQTPFIQGAFMMAFVHNSKAKWLQDFDEISTAYSGGKMQWVIKDRLLKNLSILLEVVPVKGRIAMALHVFVKGAAKGDELIWIYGGAEYRNEGSLSWKLDISGYSELGSWKFMPEACKNNLVSIKGVQFMIEPVQDSMNKTTTTYITGRCSNSENIKISDASFISEPLRLLYKKANDLPLICGNIRLNNSNEEFYWAIEQVHDSLKNTKLVSPFIMWQEGIKNAAALANRIVVQTPDKRLNALSSASASVIDAVWYPPVFVHGAMLWNIPFPGWRTIYGGTMYGWHERVKQEAAYYISHQIKQSNKTIPKADTALLLTAQHEDSRFYGVGRIDKDQAFYNFQSQFFDQLITEWRSTGDTAFEHLLRPALELHLQWQQDCFDPDEDGIYESYINGWPTDSQWYNGGGTAEETSYAYRGHEAARDMAKLDGDLPAENFHNRMMDKIRKGFFEKLWISKKGFSGAYREQGGFQRLHEDPWLYSIFLPVDVALINQEQAAASLYYSQWALQNDRMPAGGRRVWASNWVPGIWSVREMYPGDNYHLSLAFFLCGLADDGWDIMKGTFLQGAFNEPVPGNLGSRNGGTDFNDCSSMFTRVLVQGLFGYQPDYPNGIVKITPQFPKDWDSASIKTPDYSLRFHKLKNVIGYTIELNKKADMDLYLPLQVNGIKNVFVDGRLANYEMLPGYGQSILHTLIQNKKKATVTIIINDSLRQFEAVTIDKNTGDSLTLTLPGTKIISIDDKQNVLDQIEISGETIKAIVNDNAGYHTVLIKVLIGQAPQWRIIHFKVNDVKNEMALANKQAGPISANTNWFCLDINKAFNADVRTIYQQQYLSPRPNTVSVRIGSDGYSAWTFLYWKNKAPVIELDSVQFIKKDSTHILSKQNVPFSWNNENRNIAFTSLWDNWPKQITIPVHKKGEAVWLLICGSTNPMQCNIANAIIKMKYADGSEDTLSLIPPINYWNLAAFTYVPGAAGQVPRNDYTSLIDSFCIPKPWPPMVQLGKNCRAMLLNERLKKDVTLESITLQTLSQEVVVGVMGVTIMNPN